jgi:prepilin-type processing-associated H-X9-DG protein
MRSQRFKDFCFITVTPATYANHLAWKFRLRRKIPERFRQGERGQVWLNIGSGAKAHPQFVNFDGNILRWPEMWLDLRHGLPFPPKTVDEIYACHVFEHVYWTDLLRLLRECYRVLRPGGGIRFLVPSVEKAIEAYLKGDREWFPNFPVEFSSLGGRFANFLFCDGQHRLAFDFSFAVETLNTAGFREVKRVEPRVSAIFPEHVLEQMEPAVGYIDSSLVVESIKLCK